MTSTASEKRALRGLYAITDSLLATRETLEQQVEKALEGGAAIIQYRDKSDDKDRRLREAHSLRKLCDRAGALLIINDDVELARLADADGVHLGRDDKGVPAARNALGPGAVIGVSCYNEFHRAQTAQEAGADYVAFGRFFPSATKPDAIQAGRDLLERSRRDLVVPTVAIGGITPENGRALIDAGADMLAVVHGLFGQPDIRAACLAFTRLFDHSED